MDGRQPARGLTAHYFFSFGCGPGGHTPGSRANTFLTRTSRPMAPAPVHRLATARPAPRRAARARSRRALRRASRPCARLVAADGRHRAVRRRRRRRAGWTCSWWATRATRACSSASCTSTSPQPRSNWCRRAVCEFSCALTPSTRWGLHTNTHTRTHTQTAPRAPPLAQPPQGSAGSVHGGATGCAGAPGCQLRQHAALGTLSRNAATPARAASPAATPSPAPCCCPPTCARAAGPLCPLPAPPPDRL
jgi:hypothetical protein